MISAECDGLHIDALYLVHNTENNVWAGPFGSTFGSIWVPLAVPHSIPHSTRYDVPVPIHWEGARTRRAGGEHRDY